MVHSAHVGAAGNASALDAAAELLRKFDRRITAILAERSRRAVAEIEAEMAAETWFTADEALAAGLIDAIDEPLQAAAHFDPAKFGYRNVPPAVLAAMGRGPAARTSKEKFSMDVVDERPETPAPALSAADFSIIRAAYRSGALIGLGVDDVDQLLAEGVAPADLPAAMIEASARRVAARDPGCGRIPSGGGIRIVRDKGETTAARVVDSLVERITGKSPTDSTREFYGKRLSDIQAMFPAGGSRDWVNARPQAALHTTSDFPSILGTSAQRSLLDFYAVQASPMLQLSRRDDAADFRTRSRVRLGEAPSLEKVLEHGEVTSGTTGEQAEEYKLDTYGRIFGLSRQAIINDDLSAFSDQLRWWAGAVASREATALVACLSQTMSDSKALYHADHGNLAGSGGAISVTTLGAARAAMRVQKGINGSEIVGVGPKFLLVGPAVETVAEQVVTSISPAVVAESNPFAGRLTVLCEPRLSGNAWYLFADPAVMPSLEHAYLSQQPGPSLQIREGFETLGTEFRLVLDFAAASIDWRGTFKNPGA